MLCVGFVSLTMEPALKIDVFENRIEFLLVFDLSSSSSSALNAENPSCMNAILDGIFIKHEQMRPVLLLIVKPPFLFEKMVACQLLYTVLNLTAVTNFFVLLEYVHKVRNKQKTESCLLSYEASLELIFKGSRAASR